MQLSRTGEMTEPFGASVEVAEFDCLPSAYEEGEDKVYDQRVELGGGF